MAPRKRSRASADDDSGRWPAALARAEAAFECALEAALGSLHADMRLAFLWRAAGRVATHEADAPRPACIMPRDVSSEEALEAIRQELRTRMGPRACAPAEEIHFPASGIFEGFTAENTEHVDAFLYDESELDDLVAEGKLSRHYHAGNAPRDVRPLNFISHSFSVEQLRFIFSERVLGDQLKNKTVVDVGSRLGAVLYAAALFTEARRIIGVETNSFFAELQTDMIRRFALSSRVEAQHADVRDCAELLRTADVVIMNNVFEFFHDRAEQAGMWKCMRQLLTQRGLLLVTVPAVRESVTRAGADVDVDAWLEEMPLSYPYPHQEELEEASVDASAFHSEALAEQNEIFEQIHLYRVR